jgi:hypothetical protein
VVRLDEAVVPLAAGLSGLGRTWLYRAGPAGRDHADPAVVPFTATAGAAALRPYSPVRAGARRGPDGVTIRWIRRTRHDGDAWEPLDAPLGEEAERYEIDVLLGATPIRTLRSGEPAVLYPQAEELADFGAPQAALSLRLFQMSAAVGRGLPRALSVPVT